MAISEMPTVLNHVAICLLPSKLRAARVNARRVATAVVTAVAMVAR
jgi:hypothetical protein